jgi:hypothetical protein
LIPKKPPFLKIAKIGDEKSLRKEESFLNSLFRTLKSNSIASE